MARNRYLMARNRYLMAQNRYLMARSAGRMGPSPSYPSSPEGHAGAV